MNKIFFLTTACCFSSFLVSAQTNSTDSIKKQLPKTSTIPAADSLIDDDFNDEDMIFTSVEQEAQFPGGSKAWSQFLTSKLSSFEPGKNGAPKGKYQVIVRFIVSKTGKISDIQTETNHGYGMEQMILKTFKQSPDWIPAYQNGKPVNAYRRQPVTFIVE